MKLVAVLAASVALVACSSGGSTTSTTPPSGSSNPDQGQGLGGTGVGTGGTNTYPTAGIGVTKGAIIADYKFLGYKDANIAGGLTPISLGDYYDPTGNTTLLIHIQAAGAWCSACKGETTELVPLAAQLTAKKVVWIVSLAEGPTPGSPSTQTDLNNWIKEFNSPFTHVLDPQNQNLGPFYTASALPWNANINAKTMKILTSDEGAPASADELMQDIDDALAEVQ